MPPELDKLNKKCYDNGFWLIHDLVTQHVAIITKPLRHMPPELDKLNRKCEAIVHGTFIMAILSKPVHQVHAYRTGLTRQKMLSNGSWLIHDLIAQHMCIISNLYVTSRLN
jgi:hypothetical protein